MLFISVLQMPYFLLPAFAQDIEKAAKKDSVAAETVAAKRLSQNKYINIRSKLIPWW